MSEPDHPIFEMHIDARGNPSVRISDKVTLLTKEQSEQVLERFKSLVTENAELRKLAGDMWEYGYFDANYGEWFICRMQTLGIEVPE